MQLCMVCIPRVSEFLLCKTSYACGLPFRTATSVGAPYVNEMGLMLGCNLF